MLTTISPAEKKNNSKSASSNTKTTQRKVLPSFGKPVQMKGAEEEPLQGKFKLGNTQQPAQLVEEEEPLQGKFESTNPTAQLAEEEEPLQGKFESTNQPAQLAEEEEPLQGKFESSNQPAQLAEEEEPLQGKFESSNQPAQLAEEEEPLQGKFESSNQPAQLAEEEEPLQGKFESGERKSSPNWAFQLKSTVDNSTNSVTAQKSAPPANKTGLPDSLKSGVEQLSGVSMDDVKVNYNSAKPAQLHAHAFAQGKDIHVAPGQEKHVPHEAWHVVQQKQGRVQPTKQLKGTVPVNDDKGLENEADVMGAKAVHAGNSGNDTIQNKAISGSSIVQRDTAKQIAEKGASILDNVTSMYSFFQSGKEAFENKDLKSGASAFLEGASLVNSIIQTVQSFTSSIAEEGSKAAAMMPGVGPALSAFKNGMKIVSVWSSKAMVLKLETISTLSDEEKAHVKEYLSQTHQVLAFEGVDFLLNVVEAASVFFPVATPAIALAHTIINLFKAAVTGWQSYKSEKAQQADDRVSENPEELGTEGRKDLGTLDKTIDISPDSIYNLIKIREGQLVLTRKMSEIEKTVTDPVIKKREIDDVSQEIVLNKDKLDKGVSAFNISYAGVKDFSPISVVDIDKIHAIHLNCIKTLLQQAGAEKSYLQRLRQVFKDEKKEKILKDTFGGNIPTEIKLEDLKSAENEQYFWDKTRAAIKLAKERKFFSNADIILKLKAAMISHKVQILSEMRDEDAGLFVDPAKFAADVDTFVGKLKL